MDQTNDQAQNDVVETTNQVAMPATEPEEVQADQPVQQEEIAPESDQSEDKKPTRLERNLEKALSKKAQLREENERLKGQLGNVEDYIRSGDRTFTEKQPMATLFTPDELSAGYVDPELLQTRVSQYVQEQASNIVNSTLQQREQIASYKQTIQEHTRELDELVEAVPELQDPEIEDSFVELYKSINYIGDRFIGKESPKHLADRFFATARKISNRQTAELGGRVARQAQDSAVISSGMTTPKTDGGVINAYNQALNSGREEDWATYFKQLGKQV